MAKKTSKSKRPTGLSISRKGMVFTFKWKKGETYGDGQQLQYMIHSGKKPKWKSIAVSRSETSRAITLAASSFYPASGKKTLSSISFRVRGNAAKVKKTNKGWSTWSSKSFDVKFPRKPAAPSFTLSEDYSNVGTFSWSVKISDSDAYVFSSCEYQSLLTTSGETDGSKLSWNDKQTGWKTGTGKDTGSVSITEDTSVIAVDSHTRWFRVRSRGPQGHSDWAYAKHVYSLSQAAVIHSAKAVENGVGGVNVLLSWVAPSSSRTPIDKTTVQWTISTPAENLKCPDDASWNDGNASKDAAGTDMAQFSIDSQVGKDKCLFVRVNTEHDGQLTYGTPFLAITGALSAPTLTSTELDTSTNKATVTATNNSEVLDSQLAVLFRSETEDLVLGVIPHGETSVTVQCPELASTEVHAFGVYAFQGSYESVTRPDGLIAYEISANAKSEEVWQGGEVPKAPENVTAVATSISGTVQVSWDWTWDQADGAVISWANHEDAWESTDEPSTYSISSLHASRWNITGLETGVTWYIRVRLTVGSGDAVTYGPWSAAVPIDLSAAPSIPTLVLSKQVITAEETVTASWVYASGDGTAQGYGELCEATIESDGIHYGEILAHTQSAQNLTISASDAGWETGTTHYLCVRVTSASGRVSDGWSPAVSITVAEPLTAALTETSLETVTVTDDADEKITREVLSLTKLPLTATLTGAGAGGTSILVIERAASYHMERPDESEFDGFAGETIAQVSISGEGTLTIDAEDLIGSLDDGASYTLIGTVKDTLGQSAEVRQEYEVHWAHQAGIPIATAVMDRSTYSATITPTAPSSYAEGDVCDIYRLSMDQPELILEGVAFEASYVDPYPAFGEGCGHRVVCRTANGDYITEDNLPAWVDLDEEDGDALYVKELVIDFDGSRVVLPYNVKLDHSWEKDFERTRYLGGHIQGDWNPGVTRDLSAGAESIRTSDTETIRLMRELAEYPGICHVRTPDGSSFAADVEVSESREYNSFAVSFSLEIKRVDAEGFDGMTLAAWLAMQEANA